MNPAYERKVATFNRAVPEEEKVENEKQGTGNVELSRSKFS